MFCAHSRLQGTTRISKLRISKIAVISERRPVRPAAGQTAAAAEDPEAAARAERDIVDSRPC